MFYLFQASNKQIQDKRRLCGNSKNRSFINIYKRLERISTPKRNSKKSCLLNKETPQKTTRNCAAMNKQNAKVDSNFLQTQKLKALHIRKYNKSTTLPEMNIALENQWWED